jgi:hypothetical protein
VLCVLCVLCCARCGGVVVCRETEDLASTMKSCSVQV